MTPIAGQFACILSIIRRMESVEQDADNGTDHGGGTRVALRDLVAAGLMFAGTPDQVYRQIVDFEQATGGFENLLLLMLHSGALNHADTVDSLTLFGKEVLPRLREYKSPSAVIAADSAAA